MIYYVTILLVHLFFSPCIIVSSRSQTHSPYLTQVMFFHYLKYHRVKNWQWYYLPSSETNPIYFQPSPRKTSSSPKALLQQSQSIKFQLRGIWGRIHSIPSISRKTYALEWPYWLKCFAGAVFGIMVIMVFLNHTQQSSFQFYTPLDRLKTSGVLSSKYP